MEMGYTRDSIFYGGVSNWEANGELFIDVNVPSKAFEELVEHLCHTPSLATNEVMQLLESEQQNYVVLDVRRFDEYQVHLPIFLTKLN